MSTTALEAGQLRKYRAILESRKAGLAAGMGARVEPVAKRGRVSEDDLAQSSLDEFVSLRLNGMEYGQLRLVQEALDRIAAGDYGICMSCEDPIAQKRLEAIPWAKYCVQCQESLADRPFVDALPSHLHHAEV